MRATITLREGKTYRYKGYVFTESPSYLSDPEDIAYLQGIGCLNVKVDEDAPAKSVASAEEPKAESKRGKSKGKAEPEGE